MQWRVWKLKGKETREKFEDKVKELVNTEAKDLWSSFKMGFWKLVKNFVEKENKVGSKEAHDCEIRKCKRRQEKREKI